MHQNYHAPEKTRGRKPVGCRLIISALLVLFASGMSINAWSAANYCRKPNGRCNWAGNNYQFLWLTSPYSKAPFKYKQSAYIGVGSRSVDELNALSDGSVIASAEREFYGARSVAPGWGDGDWVVVQCPFSIPLGGLSAGQRGYGSGPGHSNETPVWATPVKGIYLRMKMTVNGVNPLRSGTTIAANARSIAGGYMYFFSNRTKYSARFELIKSGRVEPGSVFMGEYGDGFRFWIGFSVDGVWVANVEANGSLTVTGSTCKLNRADVSMGTVSAASFPGNYGYTTPAVPFSLQFNGCTGVSKIAYKFDAAEGEVSKENGVFKLSANSTADGLALQLNDQSGSPVPLGVFRTMATANTPSPSIPLSMSYFQLKKAIKPGSANGKLVVTVNYN